MTTTTPPVFYTVRQVADMFQLESTNQIDRGVASGELPHLRVGKRKIRFTDQHVAQIARLFEQQAARDAAPVSAPRRRRSDVDLSGVAVSERSRRRHAADPS